MLPAQERTVAELHALELVNIDGHKVDVFVKWPDGRIVRPIIIGIQDVYSRKFLSHRVSDTESVIPTRLAMADLFREFGIPKGCVLDNGRAFASKWITGGAKTRFRFKIKGEEPVGVRTGLGVRTHWTIPYRGQSKPIERAWRDFCDTIAKHPAFAGAYRSEEHTSELQSLIRISFAFFCLPKKFLSFFFSFIFFFFSFFFFLLLFFFFFFIFLFFFFFSFFFF